MPRRRSSGPVACAERHRRDAADLDDRHPRRLRRFRLAPVRLRLVAIPDPGGAPRHHQGDRRLQSGRNSGHRPRIANRLRQRRLPRALGRARRRRSASGRAAVHRLPRRLGVGLSPVPGGQVRNAGKRGAASLAAPERRGRGRLVPHSRAPARGRGQGWDDGVGGVGRDARPRPARDLLPGPSARDRLSRPRARRVLLRRARRRDRPYERYARRMARLRSRPVRRRPPQDR